MANPILMPQVGQDIESGKIIEWRVKVNDTVQKGDVIALVESDKAVFEVEAYDSGVILKLLFDEGQDARVLEPIAILGRSGEEITEATDSVEGSPQPEQKEDIAEEKSAPAAVSGTRIFSSPSARRVAREHNIEISAIEGSGPHGRIRKQDVLTFLAASSAVDVLPASPADDEQIPFSHVRRRIAHRLSESKQKIPHFYLFSDVDMTGALMCRAVFNEKNGEKITINDVIIKAVAEALGSFPRMNAHVVDNTIIVKKQINIGVAVSTKDGLLVPVVPYWDLESIRTIHRTLVGLSDGARRGIMKSNIRSSFTVSNLGMYGVRMFLPIINPPECAILGIGAVENRVVPLSDRSMGMRRMVTLSLACDHRAVDGTYAARFLQTVKTELEEMKELQG